MPCSFPYFPDLRKKNNKITRRARVRRKTREKRNKNNFMLMYNIKLCTHIAWTYSLLLLLARSLSLSLMPSHVVVLLMCWAKEKKSWGIILLSKNFISSAYKWAYTDLQCKVPRTIRNTSVVVEHNLLKKFLCNFITSIAVKNSSSRSMANSWNIIFNFKWEFRNPLRTERESLFSQWQKI